MTSDRRRQIEALVEGALAREAGERAAYLDAACAGDADLRRDVESLVGGQAEAVGLLESPLWHTTAGALTPGTRLGPYEIDSAIGPGGMGEVYKARDTRLGRTVAIKVLPPDLARDPERRRRFEHEARAAAALHHPHICPLHDLGDAELPGPGSRVPDPVRVSYLVLEHLDGHTLAERLKKGPLPVPHVLDLGAQIADALSAAHRAGIVHRDLKPANIMLTKAPAGASGPSSLHATLLDFGLAKLTGHGELPAIAADGVAASASLTERGTVLGTVPYMAPEQVEGEPADARADIWALGAVLYEMLTGRRAFEGDSPTRVAAAILEREPSPLTSQQPGVPSALVRLITRCLAKDPDGRWDSAHDVADELRWIRDSGERPGLAATPARGTSATSAAAVPRKKRWMWAGVAAAAVLALAAGAYAWSARSRPILTDRDVILLADFVNTTGDPVFDGALKQALTMQLEQSPFLALYSDQAARESLRRMGRSPDERVVGRVAREIGQREGMNAVLEGSIAPLGSHFLVVVSAVDCQTGATLVSEKEEPESKEDVVKALDRLARRLRRRLGESLASVEKYARLPEFTTSSLEALQAYNLAVKELALGRRVPALPFLQRAAELDPNFAEAYRSLAVAHYYTSGPTAAAEYAAKAYALRDRVSERERPRLLLAYHEFVTGDLLAQIATGEMTKKMYPRDTMGAFLATAYERAGRLEDALEENRRIAALSPWVLIFRGNIAENTLMLGRLEEARTLWEEVGRRFPDTQAHRYSLYRVALLQGDTAEAQRQLDWAKGKPQERTFMSYLRQQEAQAGQLTRARERDRQAAVAAGQKPAGSSSAHALNLALAGRLGPARDEARAALKEFPEDRPRMETAAFVLALTGEEAAAEKLAGTLAAQRPQDTLLHARSLAWIHAAAALMRGGAQEAIDQLAASKPYDRTEVISHYLRGLAYLQLKSPLEAQAAFKTIIDRPQIDQFSIVHPLALLGRARAAAMAGDRAASRTAYQDFLTRWKDADPDLPVLVAAKAEHEKLK